MSCAARCGIAAGFGLAIGLACLAARAAEPYDLRVILPMTGSVAFLGKAEHDALTVAEKIVNAHGGIDGRPLRLQFRDDQSSPQTAVQIAAEAVAAKPAALIGSSLVGICNAMAPLMQNGPLMYCLSPGIHPSAGAYVFTSNVSTTDLAVVLVRWLRLTGRTRIALMTSTDASGQDAYRGFHETMARPENKGVQLVEDIQFNPADASVAAQVERIKAAKPQAMIAWTTGAPIATVFKAIVQAGLDIPVATTSGNMTYEQMHQYKDFLPKTLYIPTAMWPQHDPSLALPAAVESAQQEYFAAFAAAGLKPDIGANLAWDPAMIVVAALRKLGPGATAAQMRDYISHLKNFAAVSGIYDFEKVPQRGLDEQDCVVSQWEPAQDTWRIVSKPAGLPAQP
ncbi:MAG: ABC transporter substrate-binding protein [Alphaproteobacteria bacterium]|nr:ABC transporter substrate-binding protein [Alphaproteobacteria bacterium]